MALADENIITMRWSEPEFHANLASSLEQLRAENYFTDLTIACEGRSIKTHKVILCASSPRFKDVLNQNPHQSIVILKEVSFKHLDIILDFIYGDEITLAQDQLPTFLMSAERLKFNGLLDALHTAMDEDQQDVSLKWNRADMVASFKYLRAEDCFTDVSIDCEGQTTRAHKIILWACSPYFKNILEQNPEQPILLLREVTMNHFTGLLNFMYAGEFTINLFEICTVLGAAEMLGIKALFQPTQ